MHLCVDIYSMILSLLYSFTAVVLQFQHLGLQSYNYHATMCLYLVDS